jgi:hypothetical protein
MFGFLLIFLFLSVTTIACTHNSISDDCQWSELYLLCCTPEVAFPPNSTYVCHQFWRKCHHRKNAWEITFCSGLHVNSESTDIRGYNMCTAQCNAYAGQVPTPVVRHIPTNSYTQNWRFLVEFSIDSRPIIGPMKYGWIFVHNRPESVCNCERSISGAASDNHDFRFDFLSVFISRIIIIIAHLLQQNSFFSNPTMAAVRFWHDPQSESCQNRTSIDHYRQLWVLLIWIA